MAIKNKTDFDARIVPHEIYVKIDTQLTRVAEICKDLNYEKAVKLLDKLISTFGPYHILLSFKALCLSVIDKNCPVAIEIAEGILKEAVIDEKVLNNLETVFEIKQTPMKIVEMYERAIKLNQEDEMLYKRLLKRYAFYDFSKAQMLTFRMFIKFKKEKYLLMSVSFISSKIEIKSAFSLNISSAEKKLCSLLRNSVEKSVISEIAGNITPNGTQKLDQPLLEKALQKNVLEKRVPHTQKMFGDKLIALATLSIYLVHDGKEDDFEKMEEVVVAMNWVLHIVTSMLQLEERKTDLYGLFMLILKFYSKIDVEASLHFNLLLIDAFPQQWEYNNNLLLLLQKYQKTAVTTSDTPLPFASFINSFSELHSESKRLSALSAIPARLLLLDECQIAVELEPLTEIEQLYWILSVLIIDVETDYGASLPKTDSKKSADNVAARERTRIESLGRAIKCILVRIFVLCSAKRNCFASLNHFCSRIRKVPTDVLSGEVKRQIVSDIEKTIPAIKNRNLSHYYISVINAEKVKRAFGLLETLSRDKLADHVRYLLRTFYESEVVLKNQTDLNGAEDLLILCTFSSFDYAVRFQEKSALKECMFVIWETLQTTNNFKLKQLLWSVSVISDFCCPMNIFAPHLKSVLLDTLSHYVLEDLERSAFFDVSSGLASRLLQFQNDHFEQTSLIYLECLKRGNLCHGTELATLDYYMKISQQRIRSRLAKLKSGVINVLKTAQEPETINSDEHPRAFFEKVKDVVDSSAKALHYFIPGYEAFKIDFESKNGITNACDQADYGAFAEFSPDESLFVVGRLPIVTAKIPLGVEPKKYEWHESDREYGDKSGTNQVAVSSVFHEVQLVSAFLNRDLDKFEKHIHYYNSNLDILSQRYCYPNESFDHENITFLRLVFDMAHLALQRENPTHVVEKISELQTRMSYFDEKPPSHILSEASVFLQSSALYLLLILSQVCDGTTEQKLDVALEKLRSQLETYVDKLLIAMKAKDFFEETWNEPFFFETTEKEKLLSFSEEIKSKRKTVGSNVEELAMGFKNILTALKN